MFQGTASFVGKTILTLGVGRILSKKGYKVAPFKSQNMSLNSRVIQDSREISWAQYFQAISVGITPSYHMNPILLKPIGDGRSQVIVHGKPWKIVSYKDYYKYHDYLWEKVRESIETLYREYDILIIEGAGSPAEINLDRHEIVNMKVASYLNAPVLLIGDIERGGVFASLWGTWNLVKQRELIKGFIINKFRGDVDILKPGLEKLKEMTGVPVVGVLPYVDFKFPEEDSQGIYLSKTYRRPIKIIKLPHLSNSTDFTSLLAFNIGEYIEEPQNIKNTKIIIIPGSRNTIYDLIWLKEKGFFEKIKEFAEDGGIVIGICSGYQMLGEYVENPYGIEGEYKKVKGFGFFKGKTVIEKEKTLKERRRIISQVSIPYLGVERGDELEGYEIHHGKSYFREGKSLSQEDLYIGMVKDNVFGTYLHGLFENKKITYGLFSFLEMKSDSLYFLERETLKLEKILKEALDFNYIESLIF